MNSKYKYRAFISYSHVDRRWGAWLHRKLENFKFPTALLRELNLDPRKPHLLRPIFRDREELSTGHDLGSKIETALRQSESLIVVCSPKSARSVWVNKEVLFFKQQSRDAKIFCVIVSGEPFSGGTTECLGESLRFKTGPDGTLGKEPAEPLAADLRDNGDGKRLGLLKLVAGLVGTELDALVQRDLKRDRRRVIAVTLSSMTILSVMGTLLTLAVTARVEADKRRLIAEEQIEFMMTDLKDRVVKVGSLDALDSVIRRASDYYDSFQPTLRDSEAYARFARVNLSLGTIAAEYKENDPEQSVVSNRPEYYFSLALQQLSQLYGREPNNPDLVFHYAQASYWLGVSAMESGDIIVARDYLKKYHALAVELAQIEPSTLRGRIEPLMAEFNLVLLRMQMTSQQHVELNTGAVDDDELEKLVSTIEQLYADYPENLSLIDTLAQAYAWQADLLAEADQPKSLELRNLQLKTMEQAVVLGVINRDWQHKTLQAVSGLAKALDANEEHIQKINLLQSYLPSSRELWLLNSKSRPYAENYAFLNYWYAKSLIALDRTDDAKDACEIYLSITDNPIRPCDRH